MVIYGMHISESRFCFMVFRHGTCFTFASHLCEFKISILLILLHKYDLQVNFKNLLDARFFIQMDIVIDLQ